jgi:tripartite-type tricarboxylate transporter receptor subunit TctC
MVARRTASTISLGGHISFGLGDFNYSLLDAGQIRLLLLLREEHSTEYPNVPILKDLRYDVPAPYYLGICGPRAIPDPIAKELEDVFGKAMKQPAFISGMKELHLPIMYRSGKALDDYVAHSYEVFSRIIKESQAK